MLFPTVDFAVFFVIVFTGSWMLRPYGKAWRWFLLVASCVFYLDPFNPVATDGRVAAHVNIVVGGALLLAGAATAAVLRVAFPEREPAVVGAGVAGGGGGPPDPDAPVVGDLDTLEIEPPTPARPPLGSVVAPLVVGVGLLAANIAVVRTFPERPDQSWRFLFLLLSVALINQTFARAVFAAMGPHRERTSASRWLVRIAVVVDLAVLGYFKYTNFFLEIFSEMALNLGLNLPLEIILPIAISFFTFQAISYVVDVGRGEVRPIPLLDFCVYLTFFAHVVAGPIVRVPEFAPQLDQRADPRYVESAEAFMLIFRGLFKKVVISSFLALNVVDPVFAVPAGHSRAEVLLAIYGYAIQIYADFSGYTDIAIGVALLLGIRFPINFDAPYRALSLQDFWRRWHMTLSRWLRDYLYIPLGGNRRSEGRTYVNLMITMVLGGLWHGASMSFLIWGGIHGGGLAAERWIAPRWKPLGLPPRLVAVLKWLLTFNIVCVAWVFFRTGTPQPGEGVFDGFRRALEVFAQLLTGSGDAAPLRVSLGFAAVVIAASVASQFVPPRIPAQVTLAFARLAPVLQVLVLAAGLVLVEILGPEGVAPFIYFQF